jgi:hypothetical protein
MLFFMLFGYVPLEKIKGAVFVGAKNDLEV